MDYHAPDDHGASLRGVSIMGFQVGSEDNDDPRCPHCGIRISIEKLEAPCEEYGDCPICLKRLVICMQVEVTIS